MNMRDIINLMEGPKKDTMLFHGTCIPHLAYIVQMNMLLAGNDDGEEGISFARDYDQAVLFSMRSLEGYQMEYGAMRLRLGEMPESPVVICIPLSAIAKKYRAAPYNDDGMEESEIRVFSDRIKPVLPLINKIDVDKTAVRWWLEYAKAKKDAALRKALAILAKSL